VTLPALRWILMICGTPRLSTVFGGSWQFVRRRTPNRCRPDSIGLCGGNDGGTLPITGDDPSFLTYMSTDELYNAGYQLKY
jgi:hypothetical protein